MKKSKGALPINDHVINPSEGAGLKNEHLIREPEGPGSEYSDTFVDALIEDFNSWLVEWGRGVPAPCATAQPRVGVQPNSRRKTSDARAVAAIASERRPQVSHPRAMNQIQQRPSNDEVNLDSILGELTDLSEALANNYDPDPHASWGSQADLPPYPNNNQYSQQDCHLPNANEKRDIQDLQQNRHLLNSNAERLLPPPPPTSNASASVAARPLQPRDVHVGNAASNSIQHRVANGNGPSGGYGQSEARLEDALVQLNSFSRELKTSDEIAGTTASFRTAPLSAEAMKPGVGPGMGPGVEKMEGIRIGKDQGQGMNKEAPTSLHASTETKGAKTEQIKVYNLDGSSRAVLVTALTTVRELCSQLMEKNHLKAGPTWTLIEQLPLLNMERQLEDHELVLKDVVHHWLERSANKLVFINLPSFDAMFTEPQAGCEGFLHLKVEGKKNWKKFNFVLRDAELLYMAKSKTRGAPGELTSLETLLYVSVYTAVDWKKKYGAPTDFGFSLKPAAVQERSDKTERFIKYLCADDTASLDRWVCAIRLAKHGDQLLLNLKNRHEGASRACTPSTPSRPDLRGGMQGGQAPTHRRSTSVGNLLTESEGERGWNRGGEEDDRADAVSLTGSRRMEGNPEGATSTKMCPNIPLTNQTNRLLSTQSSVDIESRSLKSSARQPSDDLDPDYPLTEHHGYNYSTQRRKGVAGSVRAPVRGAFAYPPGRSGNYSEAGVAEGDREAEGSETYHARRLANERQPNRNMSLTGARGYGTLRREQTQGGLFRNESGCGSMRGARAPPFTAEVERCEVGGYVPHHPGNAWKENFENSMDQRGGSQELPYQIPLATSDGKKGSCEDNFIAKPLPIYDQVNEFPDFPPPPVLPSCSPSFQQAPPLSQQAPPLSQQAPTPGQQRPPPAPAKPRPLVNDEGGVKARPATAPKRQSKPMSPAMLAAGANAVACSQQGGSTVSSGVQIGPQCRLGVSQGRQNLYHGAELNFQSGDACGVAQGVYSVPREVHNEGIIAPRGPQGGEYCVPRGLPQGIHAAPQGARVGHSPPCPPPNPPRRDEKTKLSFRGEKPQTYAGVMGNNQSGLSESGLTTFNNHTQTMNFILNLDRAIAWKAGRGAAGGRRGGLEPEEPPLPPPPCFTEDLSYLELGELPPPPAELLEGLKAMWKHGGQPKSSN